MPHLPRTQGAVPHSQWPSRTGVLSFAVYIYLRLFDRRSHGPILPIYRSMAAPVQNVEIFVHSKTQTGRPFSMAIGSGGLPLGRMGGGALEFPSVVFRCSILGSDRIYLYRSRAVAHCVYGHRGDRRTQHRAKSTPTCPPGDGPACSCAGLPACPPVCLLARVLRARTRAHVRVHACVCAPPCISQYAWARMHMHVRTYASAQHADQQTDRRARGKAGT